MAITVNDVRVGNNVFNTLGLIVTFLRLVERARTRKLGLDDAWVGLAVLITIVFMVALDLHVTPSTALFSRSTRIVIYYCLSQGFYGVIWCCRLSILASLQRITPPGLLNVVLRYASGVFLLIWIFLTAQAFWVCEREPSWKDTPAPQCALGESVAITQIITDVCADIFLIMTPIRVFWTSTALTTSHRLRLTAVFAAIIATTVTSMIHVYYFLRFGGLYEAFTAVIEMGISLMVCNLAVTAAVVMRLFKREKTGPAPTELSSFAMSKLRGSKTSRQAHHTDTPDAITITYDDVEGSPRKMYQVDMHDDKFGYKAPAGWSDLRGGIKVTHEVHRGV